MKSPIIAACATAKAAIFLLLKNKITGSAIGNVGARAGIGYLMRAKKEDKGEGKAEGKPTQLKSVMKRFGRPVAGPFA